MRKNVFGRRLKRDHNERKALFKSLISSLVLYGRIKTTEAKAKSIKGQVDKVVNKVKENKHDLVNGFLSKEALQKLLQVVSSFSGRNSGYTRLVRLQKRLKDNSQMVLMEWVDTIEVKNQNSKVKNDEKLPKAKEQKSLSSAKKPRARKKTESSKVK